VGLEVVVVVVGWTVGLEIERLQKVVVVVEECVVERL